MRYSLADYMLSIESDDSTIKNMFGTITIGGEGSYLDSITLSTPTDVYTTTGYATGGWVHTKSLDRTGTVSLTINQMSSKISKLKQLANISLTGDYEGFTLSLSDSSGNKVASCIDCYISNIPNQQFQSSAGTQTWEFTCGQINYN